MKSLPSQDTQTSSFKKVRIEKLIEGGYGLARMNGQVIFVPFTLPGEEALVHPKENRKGFIQAEPVQILSPSPKRIPAPCELFKKCGGCQFQHIDPLYQAGLKTSIFKETLMRIGKIEPSPICNIILSPHSYHYRNRCQIRVEHQKGQNLLGYYAFRTHRLVPVENCPLLDPVLNETLYTLSKILRAPFNIPGLRKIHIQLSPENHKILVSLFIAGKPPYPMEQLNEQFKQSLPLAGCSVFSSLGREQFGENHLYYRLAGLTLKAQESTFVQVNWDLNKRLLETVLKYSEPLRNLTVLDLFSGMGNFSLPLAKAGAQVTGVDENPSSIQDAIENAKKNNISNCRFFTANLNQGIPKNLSTRGQHHLLLLDPPRDGLSKNLIKKIIELSFPKIIYISCSSSTLARDLNLLLQNHYRLKTVQPFDFFPQTSHLETVSLLES